ncbi:uncharacterized protein YALI1_F28222g [Yarrowia lipolytica]|jgi:hypothetical protein|uniref:Uncharacterized protein n=1 Tax=Yarrowia lipolytica TaxID=4952 RepID=A0A1D8NPE9_YARLL|nr:hypothetical protein YALI1_F28222g [Yarrowia lipolytica]
MESSGICRLVVSGREVSLIKSVRGGLHGRSLGVHPGEEVGNRANELLDKVKEVAEEAPEDVTNSGDGTVSEQRDNSDGNLLHHLGEALGKGVDDERAKGLGDVTDNGQSLEVVNQSGEEVVDLGDTLLQVVVDGALGLVGVSDDVKGRGDSLEDDSTEINEVVNGGVCSSLEDSTLVDSGGGQGCGGNCKGEEDVLDGNHGDNGKEGLKVKEEKMKADDIEIREIYGWYIYHFSRVNSG